MIRSSLSRSARLLHIWCQTVYQSVSLSVCLSVSLSGSQGLTELWWPGDWLDSSSLQPGLRPTRHHLMAPQPPLSSPLHRLMMGTARNWEYFCSRYLSFTTPFTSHCALQSADNNPGIELSLNRETPISAVHTCYITTPHSNQQRREKLKQWKLDIVFSADQPSVFWSRGTKEACHNTIIITFI